MADKANNRIKIVLVERSKTSKWLAEKLDMNTSTISRWCTNETQPSLENLFRVAEVLNIDPKELIAKKTKSKTDD
jgi:transcriptional regulator with XRE-family HTH domain